MLFLQDLAVSASEVAGLHGLHAVATLRRLSVDTGRLDPGPKPACPPWVTSFSAHLQVSDFENSSRIVCNC